MGVPHQRPELVEHPPLDRGIEAPARRPVGVEQGVLAVRAADPVIYADDVLAELGEELLEHPASFDDHPNTPDPAADAQPTA